MPTSGSTSVDFTLSLRVSWQARNIQRTGRIREDNMLALVIAHHIIDRTNDIISNYHALHIGIRIVTHSTPHTLTDKLVSLKVMTGFSAKLKLTFLPLRSRNITLELPANTDKLKAKVPKAW